MAGQIEWCSEAPFCTLGPLMQPTKLGVHGMTFEKGIFAIIRSLMHPDGTVLRCMPDAVLLRAIRRFIGEFEKLVK